ncbi:MAG: orotidine-5'-phosphate decarboxylase [Acidobacteria bacterium]|nr:orotidine-5'-phosphate decarboxylase [Acidobacteriota bacterium]
MSVSEDRLSRLAVALDTPDRREFSEWCRFFGPRVGVLKVGLEAFIRWGPEAVREASSHGAGVFLDLKLHDIPNTVAGAVRSARALGVRFLTVHAGGGPAMLEAAVQACGGELQILAVTLLTHLDEVQLQALGRTEPPASQVAALARMAQGAGCHGVVCSPLEASRLRRDHSAPFLLVTPGIRLEGDSADDQRRIATPASALEGGADLLVVGRPLTRAPDRRQALVSFAEALRRTGD